MIIRDKILYSIRYPVFDSMRDRAINSVIWDSISQIIISIEYSNWYDEWEELLDDIFKD